MLIHEPSGPSDDAREIKVKIPLYLHLKLHSMKVLTRKTIADAVVEALGSYFAGIAEEQARSRLRVAGGEGLSVRRVDLVEGDLRLPAPQTEGGGTTPVDATLRAVTGEARGAFDEPGDVVA